LNFKSELQFRSNLNIPIKHCVVLFFEIPRQSHDQTFTLVKFDTKTLLQFNNSNQKLSIQSTHEEHAFQYDIDLKVEYDSPVMLAINQSDNPETTE